MFVCTIVRESVLVHVFIFMYLKTSNNNVDMKPFPTGCKNLHLLYDHAIKYNEVK